MIDLVYTLGSLAAIWLIILVPVQRRGNGRYVSRPLGRRLGLTRLQVHLCQVVLVTVTVVLSFICELAAVIAVGIFIAWVVDDWVTGDDDKPGRKHEWAKIRLRMPKPIKLRPAERWATVPA